MHTGPVMTIVIPHWIVTIASSWWCGFALGLSIGLGVFVWFARGVRLWA